MNDTAETQDVVDRDDTPPAIVEQGRAVAEVDPMAGAQMIMNAPRSLLPAPLAQLREVAFLISTSLNAPVAFQGQPDKCLSIAYQAALWRMDPIAVASKCYLTPVKGGGERLAYEAQLIHALVLSSVRFAPGGEPKTEFFGEKMQRYARVTATIAGEREPRDSVSPIIAQITPRNSPLWVTNPDQQLHYYTTRTWARMHKPDVLLGVYAVDEMPAITATGGSGTREDPYSFGALDGPEVGASAPQRDPPPPSGGAGVLVKDKVQSADKRDLGENPWPDVEDIMEWAEGFKIEIEAQPDREALAKLFDRAKGHGLLPRLKTASSTDFDAIIDLINDKNAELKKAEDEEFPGDKA